MVAVCFSAIRTSLLVFDINPVSVHILSVVALLCYSKHSSKRKGQGTNNFHSLSAESIFLYLEGHAAFQILILFGHLFLQN